MFDAGCVLAGFPRLPQAQSGWQECLYATQCQKPLPVGASGSYAVTAKLLGFCDILPDKAGETLSPFPKIMMLFVRFERKA